MKKSSTNTVIPSDTRFGYRKKPILGTAAAVAAKSFKTPVYGQNQAPSPGRVIGANDRIVVGFIGVDRGCGGFGLAHVNSQKEYAGSNNIALAAVCDFSEHHVARAQKMIGGDCKVYTDHRKLLENRDIDAVSIATPDHWHADCGIDAADAGKHVYGEIPLTRYLPEAFALADAVNRNRCVFQIGASICSDATWHKAAELVKAGKLGRVIYAQDSYCRNAPKGEWNYELEAWAAQPGAVDWDRWQGKVHTRIPFDPEVYFRWNKYYRYSAGTLGRLAPLRLHPLMLATGLPEFPSRVVALGNNPVHTDKNLAGAQEREVPEQIEMLAEFPSGLHLLVTTGTVNWNGLPSLICGHKARLEMGVDSVNLVPQREFSKEIGPENFHDLRPSGQKMPELEKNWFDCIRSGRQPIGNIELALRVQTVISLAEMSHRLNVTCLFDEQTRKITTGPNGRLLEPITYGSLENS